MYGINSGGNPGKVPSLSFSFYFFVIPAEAGIQRAVHLSKKPGFPFAWE
jgi:hypothetical protein